MATAKLGKKERAKPSIQGTDIIDIENTIDETTAKNTYLRLLVFKNFMKK